MRGGSEKKYIAVACTVVMLALLAAVGVLFQNMPGKTGVQTTRKTQPQTQSTTRQPSNAAQNTLGSTVEESASMETTQLVETHNGTQPESTQTSTKPTETEAQIQTETAALTEVSTETETWSESEAYVEPEIQPETAPQTLPETTADVELSDSILFPCSLENGKLELLEMFEFSGINPDCGNEQGENIAALRLKNTSGRYLRFMEICLATDDGDTLTFLAEDVPEGASLIAFEIDNASVEYSDSLSLVYLETEFEDEEDWMQEYIAIETAYVSILVTNNSGEDLYGLTVYCHNVFDAELFGGCSYSYYIDRLPAGEQRIIEAWDCFLGGAHVVRVTQDG